MTGKTHATCGLLIGTLCTDYYQTDLFTSITVIILAVMASLLPDICHTKSKLGRRFKIISWLVRILFGHRTFTQSLIFMLLIAILLYFIQTPVPYFTAIILAMLSHVILDMLTPRGVKLFYPLPMTIRFPIRFKTGGMVDLSLASALFIGALYVLFQPYIVRIVDYIVN